MTEPIGLRDKKSARGGTEPPFPDCGPDLTPDDLTCESFQGCE